MEKIFSKINLPSLSLSVSDYKGFYVGSNANYILFLPYYDVEVMWWGFLIFLCNGSLTSWIGVL